MTSNQKANYGKEMAANRDQLKAMFYTKSLHKKFKYSDEANALASRVFESLMDHGFSVYGSKILKEFNSANTISEKGDVVFQALADEFDRNGYSELYNEIQSLLQFAFNKGENRE